MKYMKWMAKHGYKVDILLGIPMFAYGLYVDSNLWTIAGYLATAVGCLNPYRMLMNKIQMSV